MVRSLAWSQKMVRRLERNLQGQPASMLNELLTAYVSRRLPGLQLVREALRDAAARISVGVPTRMGA
jgi:hypothetical protein